MATLIEKIQTKDPVKSKFNDEFQNYLKKQCLKTTFNGLELETFRWYKKMRGLMEELCILSLNLSEIIKPPKEAVLLF